MIVDALRYAMNEIDVPSGRRLWLYGCLPESAGDVYSPLCASKNIPATQQHHTSIDALECAYDAVILCAPKQQEESEGLLALALQRSKGFILALAANDAGGSRLSGMMESYGLTVESCSKARHKFVWTNNAAQATREQVAAKLENLAPRMITINSENWWSVPGLFGWDKIDVGSALLLDHLPADIVGAVADFGCGYGFIATNLARRFPGITALDAYDMDRRAVDLAQRNGGDTVRGCWQDIRKLTAQPRYDAIIMNPPFHSGKQEAVDLGQAFIRSAWDNLKSGGRLFFVANRHLPYEKIVSNISVLHEDKGFKILTGTRP